MTADEIEGMTIDYGLQNGDLLEIIRMDSQNAEVKTGILLKYTIENEKRYARRISGDNLIKNKIYQVRPYSFPHHLNN